MVKDSPHFDEVLPHFLRYIDGAILVAHNASFDIGFLHAACHEKGITLTNEYVDTLSLSRNAFPDLRNHKLVTVAAHIGYLQGTAHRSLDDAEACGYVLLAAVAQLDAVRAAKKQKPVEDREH